MPDTLVKRNASIVDTIKLILSRINTDVNSDFVKQLAVSLKPGGDQLAYMRRLFDYVCRNVKYQLDQEGKEDVYRPATTISNGKGDCKKMTVIIASVLKSVGIEPYIKHVFYANENYTHVYVIVPFPNLKNYIVLDPVNDCKFNEEVSYSHSNIFDLKGNRMDLYTGARQTTNPGFMDHVNMGARSLEQDLCFVTGCNCSTSGADQTDATFNQIFEEFSNSGTRGMGRKKLKEALKNLFDKATKVVKEVGAAPMRGAFLGLVRINAMQLAKHIAAAWKMDSAGIENFWKGWGGDPNELKKTIIAGSGINISGIQQSIGQGVAAAVAAATPILIAILTKLKQMKIVKEGDTLDTMANDALAQASDLVDSGGVTPAEMKQQPPDSSGTKSVRDIHAIVTQAPTNQTKMLLNNAPPSADQNNPPGTNPIHGSFFSAFGMCFWGSVQFSQIIPAVQNFPLLFLVANLIGSYFAIGFITGIGIIYQANMKWKKYIAWYFDIPKAGLSFISSHSKTIFNSLKKVSLKK